MTALVRAAHAGPAGAVTLLAVLLAVAERLEPGRVLLVGAAVLAGQLSIGWSNDLIDAARDRAVGRTDKPLASGALRPRTVRIACALALAATLPLSLACGLASGLAHLVLVASAWTYNLGLKATAWSWLPYAVSFGLLPVVVSLAGAPPEAPPAWVPIAAALLGVGAHLVNVLPDLADDAATGVHGLPHRIGPSRLPAAATAVLVAGSVVVAVGTRFTLASVVALGCVALLAAVALVGRGRTPFLAAVAIALVDAVALLAAQ
ncbi:UbiA family prenyltransferase [Nocardioides sp. cx-173]|uniref:UbiA family prenyltransferase n=1 Tax=Nocardioides sp. cx-173 TaxID=2898796 RepID=UPI001E610C34|nr:UbiA family prenyltransferase [Nocardioides sp. cx-173]MCD4526801.1 UbiA family prenyltransferase [Nocardioides sp. cx-173]UGB43904.1 UbiA family prenyltransferase [Nocardioides sp. cx-173]